MISSIERMDFDAYIGLFILLGLLIFRIMVNMMRAKSKSQPSAQPPQSPKTTPKTSKAIPLSSPSTPPEKEKVSRFSFHSAYEGRKFESGVTKRHLHDPFLDHLQVDRSYQKKRRKPSRVERIVKKAGPRKTLILLSEIMKNPF
jgi:hypothetical protein